LESVTKPRLSEDISRLGGIRLDLLAELINENVQIFDFAAIIRPPDGLEDFCVGY
jgi:hypothetical protein